VPSVRLSSASAPFDRAPVLPAAARLVLLAEGVGLLPEQDAPVVRLDLELVRGIARLMLDEGVGRTAALTILEGSRARSAAVLADRISDLSRSLTDSPMPDRELDQLLGTYGREPLIDLLGISEASLRRYVARERSVPDIVAARAHVLALVTADLSGSYNAIGVRRWWERPRSALGGRSPREVLGTDWDPDSSAARGVAALAHELVGGGAA
jgi:uncharacterized protein (DUF2384 family)